MHGEDLFNLKADTGKSFSEALILVSTNPQYDKILFGLQVQYTHENFKLRTCWEYVENMLRTCYVHELFFVFVLTFRTIHVRMFWACNFHVLNFQQNLFSYCGLVDTRISASEKDLPVH